MKIDIYYHNDFDGVSSAGIFSNFLSWFYKKDIIFEYKKVDYDVVFDFLKKDLTRETAVLDFPFHPQAKWWFDHHKTSFYSNEIKKHYSKGKYHYWNTRSKSCPSLIFSTFRKYYPEYYKTNHIKFKELISFSNIIDSALYRNPKEPFDLDNNYIVLNHILNNNSSGEIRNEIIEAIRHINLDLLFQDSWFLNEKQKIVHEFESKILHLREHIELVDNIAIVELDQEDSKLSFNTRYLSYYFYPNIEYTITKSKRNNSYHIGVGYNPWKSNNEINIGLYLKLFGGGGRKNVGAVMTTDKPRYNNISTQIIYYFSKRLWR